MSQEDPATNMAAGGTEPVPVPLPRTKLQRMRLPLMLLAPVIVIAAGIYWYIYGGRYERTDDAYTQAATVSISANVSGRVVKVDVHDNQIVQKGAPLFHIDPAPFLIAVSEAEANLSSARLQITALKSTYRQRQTEVLAARQTLAYEQQQFDRNTRLLASGIVSHAQFDTASHALEDAHQRLAGAQQSVDAVAADLAGNPDIPLEKHPVVQRAQAALDRARLNLSYTVVVAPTDGIVTKVEQLQEGDYINASTPLFALVSNHDVWIEANFKEVQLAHMRIGQSATVSIDRFPGRKFTGTLVSMSPFTGSQSALLPPENATGNWVKVVQRVPVRLNLTELDADHPLQAGLSADVSIDTQSRDDASAGPRVDGATPKAAANTQPLRNAP
jgi:membrane fusion protein (multidrug efflux system)